MPLRISSRLVPSILSSTPSTPIASFLVPFLHNQTRNASILSSLSDRPGAYNKKIRRGRGPSSGKGKTSGRGNSGQKKHGGVPAGFAGGQTAEEIAHGKMGFKNHHSVEMSPVNLNRIQDWIDQGRINPSEPITMKELLRSRAIHRIKDGVKLLADGASLLTTPINVVVSRASKTAIAAVEAIGGTVTTRYYTPLSIRRIKMNQMHPYVSLRWDQTAINKPALNHPDAETPEQRVKGLGFEYRLPDPISRKDLEYYRDPEYRGYLSHTIKEGEGPSLYFKPPLQGEELRLAKEKSAKKAANTQNKEDNSLW